MAQADILFFNLQPTADVASAKVCGSRCHTQVRVHQSYPQVLTTLFPSQVAAVAHPNVPSNQDIVLALCHTVDLLAF